MKSITMSIMESTTEKYGKLNEQMLTMSQETPDLFMALVDSVRDLLSSTYFLNLKTQSFHWNIKGPNFVSLHELLGEHYEEMAGAVDMIAEHIRALGVNAPANIQDLMVNNRIISDTVEENDWTAMISELHSDHVNIISQLRELDRLATEAGMADTIDIVASRLLFHTKAEWMLRSILE